MSFKLPSAYPNEVLVSGARIGGSAFEDMDEAKKAFGFNVIGAGMLPVQVVIDNTGSSTLSINGAQSFLEDKQENLWPVLDKNTAYERASKFAETKQIFTEGAYKGFLGAAVGSVIGAAVGVVTGENVGSAMGKGAAIGGALGSTAGAVSGYNSEDAQHSISNDLQQKSLQNKEIPPGTLAHGILFFPAEAKTAKHLRLQLVEKETGKAIVADLFF